MVDILPRFSDGAIRNRMRFAQSGKEVSILIPQGIVSERRCPLLKRHTFGEGEVASGPFSPSENYIDILVNTVLRWLNEDVFLWCQYGARIKVIRLADTHTLTLYPYSNL